jgi:hypothetical protein
MIAADAVDSRQTTSTTQHGNLFVHVAIFANGEICAIIQTDEAHRSFRRIRTSACTPVRFEEIRGATDPGWQAGITLSQSARARTNRQL